MNFNPIFVYHNAAKKLNYLTKMDFIPIIFPSLDFSNYYFSPIGNRYLAHHDASTDHWRSADYSLRTTSQVDI